MRARLLRHLASGLTNKQIAEAMHISYETIKEHTQHILRKNRCHRPYAGSSVGSSQEPGLNKAVSGSISTVP